MVFELNGKRPTQEMWMCCYGPAPFLFSRSPPFPVGAQGSHLPRPATPECQLRVLDLKFDSSLTFPFVFLEPGPA